MIVCFCSRNCYHGRRGQSLCDWPYRSGGISPGVGRSQLRHRQTTATTTTTFAGAIGATIANSEEEGIVGDEQQVQ